jgi:hypothetical protein
MGKYSGGKDDSENRDQPFTGDGGRETVDNRLPAKGEIVVRTSGGSAQLKQTHDLFDGKGKHAKRDKR